jgi:hypothetical protein
MVGTLVPVRLDNSPIGKLIEVSLMLLHFSRANRMTAAATSNFRDRSHQIDTSGRHHLRHESKTRSKNKILLLTL